jgi:hypothetical protein
LAELPDDAVGVDGPAVLFDHEARDGAAGSQDHVHRLLAGRHRLVVHGREARGPDVDLGRAGQDAGQHERAVRPERVSTLTPPRIMSKPARGDLGVGDGASGARPHAPRMASPCSSVMSPRSTRRTTGTSTSTRRPAKRGARTPSV